MLQTKSKAIRIIIIDDHPLFRLGLSLFIESRILGGTEFQVVGEAGNRTEALKAALSEQPDVILLDLILKDEPGLDLLPDLLLAAKHARVLALAESSNADEHYQAVRLGAMGVILKGQEPEILFRALESVHSGKVWLEHTMTLHILGELLNGSEAKFADPESERISRLTSREREVILLIGEGMKNKIIAERLFISEVTVRHHLTSIFSKLGVEDRLELAIYAYQHGLAKLPTTRRNIPFDQVGKRFLPSANR